VGGLLAATEAANLTLRKGVGSADGWLFELRAEHPEALSTYQRYLAENDVDAELVRMHELDDHSTTSRYNLTPEQREALLTAYDGGYYDQPTDTDLESLADELSISRSAFSARLQARLPEPRRGHHRPRTGTERRPIARPPFNPDILKANLLSREAPNSIRCCMVNFAEHDVSNSGADARIGPRESVVQPVLEAVHAAAGEDPDRQRLGLGRDERRDLAAALRLRQPGRAGGAVHTRPGPPGPPSGRPRSATATPTSPSPAPAP